VILYIHGFGGSGQGKKADALRVLFKNEGFVAPSLPVNPALAIATLEELIAQFLKHDRVCLIGSSLGGFYTLYLARKFGLKAALVNPAVRPYETLRRALGATGGENFFDGSRYEWNEEHLQTLESLTPIAYEPASLLLFLQKGDELLDYREAAELLTGCEQVIEEGGAHSFEGIERHAGRILDFFGPNLKGPAFSSDRITQAITFAAKAHGEQKTPFGYPYLHHLMTVAMHTIAGVRNDGFAVCDQENAIIAALLHDTIEDTAIEYADVEAAFGKTIADAVAALTKEKLLPNKADQMADSLHRIQAQPKWVWCVKLADRITNLSGVPPHWDAAKKETYLTEARAIHSALCAASADLAARLKLRIEQY
jgi:predicted esterase YcpF (UPF0227 family)